jgi:hypothetical protein
MYSAPCPRSVSSVYHGLPLMANRSRGQFDLTITTGDAVLGFNLAPSGTNGDRPPVVKTEVGAGRADELVRNADVPRVIDSLDRGMGFSRRVTGLDGGYSHALPGYTRAPGAILCPPGAVTPIPFTTTWSPTGPIIDSVLFGANIYLLSQTPAVLEMAGGSGTPTPVASGDPTLFRGQGMAVLNDKLYVAGDAGGLIWKDGPTGPWYPAPTITRAKLATATWRPQGIPTDFMVGVTPGSTVRYVPATKNPLVDADWSAPVRVGHDTTTYIVQKIVKAPRHLYFLRADGAWDIDELGTRAVNIAPWIAENPDQNNGLWGIHAGAGLYYGASGGLAFVPTDGTAQQRPIWCHPGEGLPYEGPVRGQPLAGTMHNGWLLTGYYDTVASYICAGRPDERAAPGTTHVWHGAEAVFPGERITHMAVYTTSAVSGWPRLLIATMIDGTSPLQIKLYWMSLTKFGTPLQELLLGTPFVPAASQSLFLPADPWDRPSSVKTMLQFDLLTERLTDSNYFRTYARADAGAFAEQGMASDGAYTSLSPVDLIEGRYISTRIDGVGAPVLRSAELRAAVGIELREARTYTLVLGWDDGLKTARGRENRDPETRMAELMATLGRVVTLDDGTPLRVRVLQVLPAGRRQIGTARRAGAWAIVADVMVSILDRPFAWGGPAIYGGPSTWS